MWETAGRDGTMKKLFELWSESDMCPVGLIGVSVGEKWRESDNRQEVWIAVK